VKSLSASLVKAAIMSFWESFWDILWWTLWILVMASFFVLVVRILIDVFSDDSLGGWGKFFWTIFIIFLPIIGSLVYLSVRGPTMGQRSIERAASTRAAQVDYMRGLMDEARDG
jgi:magnesium-transporting ATPase (P-type)